jgi:hypothetical protein
MRSKIYMYLFFFAVLFVIFQYMNEKTIFESQEKKISSLSEKVTKATDSIESLNSRVADLTYFTLQGNDDAMTYFESLGYNAAKVEALVSDVIYEKNFEKGGNSLIKVAGINGIMQVNKLKFLNHKWIIADFSDGTYWGEMLLEYYFDNNKGLQITTMGSALYPSN